MEKIFNWALHFPNLHCFFFSTFQSLCICQQARQDVDMKVLRSKVDFLGSFLFLVFMWERLAIYVRALRWRSIYGLGGQGESVLKWWLGTMGPDGERRKRRTRWRRGDNRGRDEAHVLLAISSSRVALSQKKKQKLKKNGCQLNNSISFSFTFSINDLFINFSSCCFKFYLWVAACLACVPVLCWSCKRVRSIFSPHYLTLLLLYEAITSTRSNAWHLHKVLQGRWKRKKR